MEYSSYELSVQLRDAGFPQPDIDNGQVWWRMRFPDGTLRHPAPFQYIKMVAHALDGGNFVSAKDQVYAPTPLDILKELPNGTTLRQDIVGSAKMWVVETPNFGDVRGRIFRSMSEFTALSDAYLYKEETDEDEMEMNKLGYQSERQALARIANEANSRNNQKL